MVTTRKQSAPPPPPPPPPEQQPTRRSNRARKPIKADSMDNIEPTTNKKGSKQQQKVQQKKINSKKINSKKTQAKQSNNKRKNGKNNSNKRKVTPKYFIDPETDEQIWVSNATLQDIQIANKKKRPPWPLSRRYLVTIPSQTQRNIVYDKISKALSNLEERILPKYGNRSWKCIVTVQDNNKNNSSPYFLWHKRGYLILATLPHIIEKIPQPPRFPGYYSSSITAQEQRKRNNNKKFKKKSTTTTTTNNTEGDDDDNDNDKNNNDSKEEEADDDDDNDDDEEEEEDEVITEEMSQIYELQEREITSITQLAWDERWRVPIPSITYKWISPLRQTYTTRKSAWEHAIQLCKQEVTIDKVLHGLGANGKELKLQPIKRKMALLAGKLRFERDGLWVVGQEEFWAQQRLDEIEEEENEIDEKELQQQQEQEQPIKKKTRAPRRLTGYTYFVQCNRKKHREKRLEEMNNSEQQQQQKPALIISPSSKSEEHGGGGDNNNTNKKPDGNNKTTTEKVSFTLRDAANELRDVWNDLTDEEKKKWDNGAKKRQDEIDAEKKAASLINAKKEPVVSKPDDNDDNDGDEPVPIVSTIPPSTPEQQHGVGRGGSVVSASPIPHQSPNNDDDEDNNNNNNNNNTNHLELDMKPSSTKVPSTALAKKHAMFEQSKRFGLNAEQIKICYDAGMEHYDKIMRTVTARDLTCELQDGFDLLRERCRGRFDMELPVFETNTFSFLNDIKKSPWMPIVREILGKDVVLIHKGMFLSMPGSAKQPYHQDGLHLTTQYQKPCHAINVFVPLVDLTMENGPTEFCLGTHILGREELDEDFIEVPTGKAGMPIIFDYRLGHRGLANTSKTCRPIVYCTYAAAADGKEFRDSVNFSRKRYHRIGDLVEKGLSREERAEKRQRLLEEKQLNDAILASTAK